VLVPLIEISVEKLANGHFRLSACLEIPYDRKALGALLRAHDDGAGGTPGRGELELFPHSGVPETILDGDASLPQGMRKLEYRREIVAADRDQKGAELVDALGAAPRSLRSSPSTTSPMPNPGREDRGARRTGRRRRSRAESFWASNSSNTMPV